MTKNLGEMTVKELKEVAKSIGVKGYSSMTKAELISSIEEMDGTTVETTVSQNEKLVVINDTLVNSHVDAENKYLKYLTYRDQLRPVVTKEVNWKGKMRPRYECPLCSAKIGNPEDHFCYNCGARLRADEAYEKYINQK